VLRNTLAVANMIRDAKTFQIPSAMQIAAPRACRTFDDGLRALLAAGRVTLETAAARP